jgi:hypothetical protein
MPPPIDYSDPCAAFERLRESYFALLEGRRVEMTEFETGSGTRRRVQFTKANAELIREEMRRLEGECQKKRGGSPRFAIRGG